jgi:hypothetical protein
LKKYAHLNFYAGTGSEKVLVFAEFHTDAVGDNEPDEWGLSSCKLLRKNYQGNTFIFKNCFTGLSVSSIKEKTLFSINGGLCHD